MAKYHVVLQVTNPDSGTTRTQLYTEHAPNIENAIENAKFTAKFNWRVSKSNIKCIGASEVNENNDPVGEPYFDACY